jgi:hypothetical protein
MRRKPRLLTCRVDWFQLAFRGALRGSVVELLRGRLQEAQSLARDVAVEIAPGLLFVLCPRTSDGMWRLSHAQLSVLVDAGATGRWYVEVTPRAMLLASLGVLRALEFCRLVAALFLNGTTEERTRRVDLCADFARFPLHTINPRAWVARQRTGVVDIGTLRAHLRAGRRTGFVVGKRDISLRVYDKTEELRQVSTDAEKREAEHARWREQGWDGQGPVTRVEFQIRGAALDELDLRTPEGCIRRRDNVWKYLTGTWVRLVVLKRGARRYLCANDARWDAVVAVIFENQAAEPATRQRVRNPADPRLVVGVAMSYAARRGLLEAALKRGRAKPVDTWSASEATAFVNDALDAALHAAARSVAADLVETHGPRRAAQHLLERLQATKARHASLGALTGEDSATEPDASSPPQDTSPGSGLGTSAAASFETDDV